MTSLGGWGATEVKTMIHPEKSCIRFLITIIFLTICSGDFNAILLLILGASRWYVEFLYKK